MTGNMRRTITSSIIFLAFFLPGEWLLFTATYLKHRDQSIGPVPPQKKVTRPKKFVTEIKWFDFYTNLFLNKTDWDQFQWHWMVVAFQK